MLKCVVEQAVGRNAAKISVRPPLTFQSNRLYDVWVNGRHLIAKEFLKPDELQDAPAREFQALQLLEPLDIAPRPVFYDPDMAPVVVYEFMEGEMWDRKRPSPSELTQLTEVWLKMHTVPNEDLWFSRGHHTSFQTLESRFHDSFQKYTEWTAVAYPAGQRSAESCLDLLTQFRTVTRELTAHAPALCFCRSDPRFANVIQRPDGRLGLVDWEDSGLRDPARDLADLITHPNQEDLLHLNDWQAFLTPYLAKRGQLDATIQDRLHLYLAIFPIFWLAILLEHGIQKAKTGTVSGWHTNRLPVNEQLRRYLARALAWPDLAFHSQLAALAQIEFFPS